MYVCVCVCVCVCVKYIYISYTPLYSKCARIFYLTFNNDTLIYTCMNVCVSAP